MPRRHSPRNVAAYVKFLQDLDAPAELVRRFQSIVEIDNGISSEGGNATRNLESLDRLLFDVCRRYNFTKPFDTAGKRAFIRPYLLDTLDPHFAGDCASNGDDFSPQEEQSYRRGYDQGFAEAMRLLPEVHSIKLHSRNKEIHHWRVSKIFFGPSPPGLVEEFGIGVSLRLSSDRNVSVKLRYSILERDAFRCVVCGDSSADGARLHVDHIISIFNGGSNEPDNLQTLCEYCNLGKGKQ